MFVFVFDQIFAGVFVFVFETPEKNVFVFVFDETYLTPALASMINASFSLPHPNHYIYVFIFVLLMHVMIVIIPPLNNVERGGILE